jgi:hypothetical protein
MTPTVLLLAFAQAGLLLWSAVNLSNTAMKRRPALAFFLGALTLALAIASVKYSGGLDPLRALCSPADCVVLVFCVACVRVLVVSKEEEHLMHEHAASVRFAAERAEAARREMEAERVRAAAAALEAHKARLAERQTQPPMPARHLATPILRGGARSPRFPGSPKP